MGLKAWYYLLLSFLHCAPRNGLKMHKMDGIDIKLRPAITSTFDRTGRTIEQGSLSLFATKWRIYRVRRRGNRSHPIDGKRPPDKAEVIVPRGGTHYSTHIFHENPSSLLAGTRAWPLQNANRLKRPVLSGQIVGNGLNGKVAASMM